LPDVTKRANSSPMSDFVS